MELTLRTRQQQNPKILKKHAQKTERKTRHPLSTKSAPTSDQNTADKGGKGRDPGWNPPRKKKNTAKTRLTAGKGACWKETRRHSQSQHAPAVGLVRPGGESRLPAAIVPPPGLGKIICMRKICKKFHARSMQVYFLQKKYLKK